VKGKRKGRGDICMGRRGKRGGVERRRRFASLVLRNGRPGPGGDIEVKPK